MMAEPIILGNLQIIDEWPDSLLIVKVPGNDLFGCFSYQDIRGLAVFSDQDVAQSFGCWLGIPNIEVIQVSFDEARDVAKSRRIELDCMMLLDDITDPVIHWVR